MELHSWRPSAALATLRQRAVIVAALRAYFDDQGVLEVSTPALIAYGTSEPTLVNLTLESPFTPARRWFLRTSPEAAMKRLVASGSGDIYQLGPVFRADERGRHHLTEFTLLEWYRLGFGLVELMDDVERALRAAGFARAITRVPYGDLFAAHFGVQPHALPTTRLAHLVAQQAVELAQTDVNDRALLLDCLYACVLEPALRGAGAIFLYDYPVELRAYARVCGGPPLVAARFELIIDGLELANGYHEIVDADEQAQCFADDNSVRRKRGLSNVAPDQRWLQAMSAGMPACAGVALGIERLLMALGLGSAITDVTSFGHELDGNGAPEA